MANSRIPQNRQGPKLFLFFILLGIFFLAGFVLGSKQLPTAKKTDSYQITVKSRETPKNLEVDFSLFWDVWQRVTTQHLDKGKFDPAKLVEGAISGLVAATGDPYSAYLPPEQNAQVKAELAGFYEGVGIQIGVKNGKIVVIAPLSGTPADKQGVKAQDLILKIDDKETTGLSLPEAVSLIRGKEGTKVKLILQRGDSEPFEKELVREKIEIKSVEVSFEEVKPGVKIAILTLARFGDNTNAEWDNAVAKILENATNGVVLDLRNNPGGFLSGSVYVASEFIQGKVVGQKLATGETKFFTTERVGKLRRIPLVVVTNSGTASAAEIVAGALQEKKRAKLIGDATFGKGTVQDAQDLSSGAGLHLTIAKWLLPSGRDINGAGLVPDIEVKNENDQDSQLEKAKEVLKGLI